MVDKVARFVFAFDGDEGDIATVLSQLKSRVRQTASEIEAITRNIQLFKDAEANVKRAGDAFDKAHLSVVEMGRAIARVRADGKEVGPELTAAMRATERALSSASREYNKQSEALKKISGQLEAAGVDTKNLAAEEERLALAASQANRALVEQSSKALLGFKSVADIKPKVAELNAAFLALRDSGKLSFGEVQIAQARLQQSVAALRAESVGLGSALTDIRGKVLAFGLAFAGVATAVLNSVRYFRDFRQQVSAVESISDVTTKQVEEMGVAVRQLAVSIGVDAVGSLKALYEIISSGIPENNALTVLEAATKAAIAGLTDVETAARIGVSAINAYGLQITQLDHVYDVLFQTVRDGIVTFPELAKNLGQVFPAARAANIGIEQLGAAMVVLTRQGIDAPEAATALNRAIIDLSAPAPEARDKLRELGIEMRGLQGTIEQIAAKKFTFQQLQQIVPDVRATRAVLALANNFTLLSQQIDEMTNKVGTAQQAYLKLADTPEQKVRRFTAAINDLKISFGEFAFGGGALTDSITALVNSLNKLDPALKSTVFQFTALAAGAAALLFLLRQLAVPFNLLIGALAATNTAGLAAASGLTAAATAGGALRVALAGLLGFQLGKELRENFGFFRQFGDELGLVAAAASNLGEFGLARLKAALTGNRQAADQATAAYRRNKDIIDQQWSETISGATERLRQFEAEQQRLVVALEQASQAAAKAAATTETSISRVAGQIKLQITSVEQIITTLQQRLQNFGANAADALKQIGTATDAELTRVTDKLSRAVAEQALLQQKELANLLASIEIQRKAASERLLIIQQFQKEAVKAFEAEATTRLQIALKTGQDMRRVENDITIARAALLQGIVQKYQEHYANLLQQEQGHLDKIKAIQEQRIALNQSIEDKIREIRRGGLSVYEQYADRVKQIDEAISKARIAALTGDSKKAEEFATRAISLIDGIGKEVKEGSEVVVSGFDAQEDAVKRLRNAQEILNFTLNQREQAEKKGAEASKAAAEATKIDLDAITAKLEKAQALARQAIELNIKINAEGVDATVRQLDEQIEKRDRLMRVSADITEAELAIKSLRSQLEKGVTAEVQLRTDTAKTALAAVLKEIQDQKPELQLEVKTAIDSIGLIQKEAAKIDTIRHEIDVNVDKARKEIDSLNGRDTKSTHTIKIVIDRSGVPQGVPVDGIGPPAAAGFARGGYVPRWTLERHAGDVPVQRFAGGGDVFPTPRWQKVPGSGTGDTVRAALQPGSFVMRKAAVNYYGDSLMTHIASGNTVQHFALGGGANIFNPGPIAEKLLATGKPPPGLVGNVGFGDPELHAIIVEAFRVITPLLDSARSLRQSSTGQNISTYLARVLELIQGAADARDARQLFDGIRNDLASLKGGIEQARRWNVPIIFGAFASGGGPSLERTNIAAEASKSSFGYVDPISKEFVTWFDVGAARLTMGDAAAKKKFPGAKFAAGGSVADTVPAMLTPGEYVMRPAAVRHFGADFMAAVNSMRVPRAALAGFLATAMPAPAVAHFATGGPVGETIVTQQAAPAAVGLGAQSLAVNVTASASDLLSRENVQRFIVPVLEEFMRRSGRK